MSLTYIRNEMNIIRLTTEDETISPCTELFRNRLDINLRFFTVSLEIRNRATWDQAHCCFLIFPTFSHSFWKKKVLLKFRNFVAYRLCCFRVLGEKSFVEILNSFDGYVNISID
ncbi:hypothetical protein T06_15166 [Trichinella sp. T6]|nr:hypothetical protein T06_4397 [Trichinella sp. T6]KRX51939.1 hypothetical protein T06_7203 [Trichinella sp. T6]KRX54002.1 hypothetical protein T06_15166 [Trichinella sp. T6]